MPDPGYTAADQNATEEALKLRIGRAVAAWSFVESSLATWFERLTKMHPVVSRKTFYSLTGFDARARMLRAVIGTVKTDPDISAYLTAIVKKASQYTHTRNMIVHGDVLFVGYSKSKYFKQAIILQGRQHWTEEPPDSEVLTARQLEIAAENFGRLATIISLGLNWDGVQEKSPLRFLELIRAMPNPAHSSRLDQSVAERIPLADTDQVRWWR